MLEIANMNHLLDISGFLFAKPSFSGGAARCLDIGSTQEIYNESSSESMADYDALMADWMAVGADMCAAIKTFEQENAR